MNGWRHVPTAALVPQCCAVLPQLGAAHREGYIDVGTEMVGYDPHTYISVHAARQLGAFLGMVDAEESEARVKAAEARADAAEAELSELRAKFDAIDVLASAGFQARKKPGRPKEKV